MVTKKLKFTKDMEKALDKIFVKRKKKPVDNLKNLQKTFKKVMPKIKLNARGKALDWKVHWQRKTRDGTKERLMRVWSPSKKNIIYKKQIYFKNKGWVTQR